MGRQKCVHGLVCLAVVLGSAAAQTNMASTSVPATADGSAAAPAEAAAAAPPEWSVGGIDFSGLIDGYYSLNFNHPASRANEGRNFDVRANQFSLNMAKLSAEHAPDPIGFRFDLGFGRAFEIVHANETGPGIFRNIEQAYLSVKPPRTKGLEVDFGEFVTWAGAEVIETQSNWNYSRSLLFAYAIPYYHFGLRALMPVTGHFSAGAALVNGWNNVEDNNTGKTGGFTGVYTTGKFTWTHNYYVGPEKNDTNKGLRHLYDTTLLLTPWKTANFYVNFDYGVDRNVGRGARRWAGVAGAARFAVSRHFALAPRLEWFNDADGLMTGAAQKVKEATLTGEYKMADGFLARIEYRHDWSNVPFFDRGAQAGVWRTQPTLLAGFVAFFGPKR